MSQGDFADRIYETDLGLFANVSIQPETESLTLALTANAQGAGPLTAGLPSAKVSGGRQAIGINCRKVRVRFTGTIPPGYSGGKSIITLPVLTPAAFAVYASQTTGTYTLEGVAYDVAFVGKTAETLK